MAITDDKARLRSAVRARRNARPDAERAEAAQALAMLVRPLLPPVPGTVIAYLSMPAEPGTESLLEVIEVAGHRVLVPRVTPDGLAWVRATSGSAVVTSPWGIREPVAAAEDPGALAAAGLILLPGLAVDRAGHRLGQGGGYYDRALADVPRHSDGGPLRVIVLHDDEVLDEVPFDERDCVVDAALTPSGLVRLGGSPSAG